MYFLIFVDYTVCVIENHDVSLKYVIKLLIHAITQAYVCVYVQPYLHTWVYVIYELSSKNHNTVL